MASWTSARETGVIQFTTKVRSLGALSWHSGSDISFAKPKDMTPLAVLLEKAEAKCGGYVSLRLDLPHRPRTTGWKSQNHHLRGHVRQLCGYTGFTMQEMMQAIKEECPNWPVDFKEFRGKRRTVYASEADINVEICSEAIEITHRIAADLAVRLVEEATSEA